MPRQPNIVLTIADDQRWNTIHVLGNSHINTPHLDRLAQRGTSYLRAQHGGSTHGAICAPSRAQLHTGRTLFHTSDSLHAPTAASQKREADPARPLPTLGSILRESGYDTFGVGKWHNETESFARSFTGGRDVFFGGMCPHFCVSARDLEDGQFVRSGVRSGHSTEVFSGAAVDFLRRRSRSDERPFFLYVAFTAPHDPRETHYRFRAQYREEPPLPENFRPEHPFELAKGVGRDEALAEFPRRPEEVRMHLADYYAMITHMDEGIGRIHTALEQAGLSDDTIVVHTADHGLAVGCHGLMGKQSLYDHSTRVPMIVAGPGFERDATDERLCYQHDLHPTLLAAAGLENPECEYQHLQSATPRDYVGCSYAHSMRSIRDGRYKLIEYDLASGRRTQLFDTTADPLEMNDLSSRAEHADALGRLRGALKRQMAEVDDPLRERFA